MKLRLPFVISDDRARAAAITPTADERLWWREASKPERRRILSIWTPWYLAAIILPVIVRDPTAFFGGKWKHVVPTTIIVAVIGGIVIWRASSPSLLRKHLVGKRIRDALLACTDPRIDPPRAGDAD